MPEAPELLLPRQSFQDRHPQVADVSAQRLPKTLGIALGSADFREYPAIVQSALSVVHEYSDSPLKNIVIFADALVDPSASDMSKGYIANYLEGVTSNRIPVFQRDRINVAWVGGESVFTARTREATQRVKDQTSGNPDINLYIVIDPSKLELKPDILLKSEKTSTETGKTLVGFTTKQVSVGESLTEINSAKIDKALVNFARRKPQAKQA